MERTILDNFTSKITQGSMKYIFLLNKFVLILYLKIKWNGIGDKKSPILLTKNDNKRANNRTGEPEN